MQGATVLFGQILAVVGIVSTGTSGAAQWTAAQRSYLVVPPSDIDYFWLSRGE
jgi:hypothetical protein